MIDVKAAINRGIALKPLQQWPQYGGGFVDRTKYVTASEVGYCERKVWLDKEALRNSGYDPAAGTGMPSDWGMLERGHAIEAWAVEALTRGTNLDLQFYGQHQVSFAEGYQSATPDGVFMLDEGSLQLELKSIDPRTNWNKLPKPVHVDQVIQAADLVSHCLDTPPLGGLLVYIDASDYKKQVQFHIPFENEKAEALEARAERIMLCTDPAELQPEGMYKDHCKFCAHTARCGQLNAGDRQKVAKNDELTKLADKLFGQR